MAHAHSHGEDHAHGHQDAHAHGLMGHAPPTDEKRLRLALFLTGGFMVAEVAGGVFAGSLALLADAGHMLSDTLALALAFFALRLARRPADRKRSYGYRRLQVLAAFTNAVLLIGIAVLVFIEAAQRLFQPVEVLGVPMLVVAVLGLVVNLAAFQLLNSASAENLNVRGALLHVVGDLLGSLAAIIAAFIILLTGWMPADPLLSILVAGMILRGAVPILREAGHILLEGTPRGIDAAAVTAALKADLPEVADIHHVHIWSLDPGEPLITLHVVLREGAAAERALASVQRVLLERFKLSHATIQIEGGVCSDDGHAAPSLRL